MGDDARDRRRGAERRSGIRRRPERFVLAVTIDYREMSSVRWQTGRTVEISQTGVAFVAETPLERGARIEVVVRLTAGGREPAAVAGKGYIARVIDAAACTLAAAIEHWSFEPAGAV